MTASATWHAWSCLVRLVVDDDTCLVPARRRLETLMAEVGSSVNRFDPDSDLSRINRSAGSMVSVRARTLALVDAALDAAALTGGAVDPTVGMHMMHNGYAADIEFIRGQVVTLPTAKTPRQADWTRVQMNHEVRHIGVPVGIALDLGATAKSFTADMAALELSSFFGTAVLVEIGGDVSVGGRRANGWTIAVGEQAGGPGQDICVSRGGVATSSTTSRRWQSADGELHHIIDPRTGRPAVGPWRTVSVWSDTALQANTASTAAIVLGDEARPYLQESGYAARLVGTDGEIVMTGHWPMERRAA